MIKENLKKIKICIEKSAEKSGLPHKKIRIIAVTKEASSARILEALDEGLTELGENRVGHALLRQRAIDGRATWHMIGHLQTNKARDAVSVFFLIHSVDSVKLAEAINKEAARAGKVQDALLEVNVSGEGTKYGVSAGDVKDFLQSVKGLANIRISGLMTVAPLTDNPENSRKYFKTLKALADREGLRELSMGMSQDYGVAVEEGATMIRLGRAIFGSTN